MRFYPINPIFCAFLTYNILKWDLGRGVRRHSILSSELGSNSVPVLCDFVSRISNFVSPTFMRWMQGEVGRRHDAFQIRSLGQNSCPNFILFLSDFVSRTPNFVPLSLTRYVKMAIGDGVEESEPSKFDFKIMKGVIILGLFYVVLSH